MQALLQDSRADNVKLVKTIALFNRAVRVETTNATGVGPGGHSPPDHQPGRLSLSDRLFSPGRQSEYACTTCRPAQLQPSSPPFDSRDKCLTSSMRRFIYHTSTCMGKRPPTIAKSVFCGWRLSTPPQSCCHPSQSQLSLEWRLAEMRRSLSDTGEYFGAVADFPAFSDFLKVDSLNL